MKRFLSFFAALFCAVSVPALPPPIQPQQLTTNSGVALVTAAQSLVRTNLALIGGNITGNTNLQVDLYENGGGSGGQRMFSVRDSFGGKLLELNPRATAHSNYWTLFFGDQTTNGIGANLSDVFFMQSSVGYYAIRFGDDSNSFWFTGDGPATWSAHGGDLGGLGDAVELFDNYGNLFLNDVHLTNTFAKLSKFNTGQFTASSGIVTIKNFVQVTNLSSHTTLATDGTLGIGSDAWLSGEITPGSGTLTINGELVADGFSGSGAGLTGIPGSGLQNPLTVTTVNSTTLNVSGSSAFAQITVAGETNSSLTASTIVGTDANKKLNSITVGSGLSLSGGTLSTGAGAFIASTNGTGTNVTLYSTGGNPAIQIIGGSTNLFGGTNLFTAGTTNAVLITDTNGTSVTRIYTQSGVIYSSASPPNRTISVDEWTAASGRIIATGVDGKTVANTTLYTVPSGRQLIVQQLIIIPTTVTSLVTLSTLSLGKTSSAYTDVVSATLLTGITGGSTALTMAPVAGAAVLQAGDALVLRVSSGAVATTYTFTAVVIGVLL